MKWYAIKGPDGEWVAVEPYKSTAWWRANIRKRFGKSTTDRATARQGERLGYRCVEVELAEPGTTEALKRARLAWDALVSIGCAVTVRKDDAAVRDIAMQTLGEVLGRVTDNAAGEGGEGEKP